MWVNNYKFLKCYLSSVSKGGTTCLKLPIFYNLCQFTKIYITNLVPCQFWWVADFCFNGMKYILIEGWPSRWLYYMALWLIKEELHSNYIFLYFVFIGLKSFYKNELFFSSKTHILEPFTQDIYMTFYLLTWTYLNDVNGTETF